MSVLSAALIAASIALAANLSFWTAAAAVAPMIFPAIFVTGASGGVNSVLKKQRN